MSLRHKWSRRFQDALREVPAAAPLETPEEPWPPPPPAAAPAPTVRPPTHDYSKDVQRLEEELLRLREQAAQSREAQRKAEIERDALRSELALAQQGLQMLTLSLEDAQSRAQAPDEALRAALLKAEQERDHANAVLVQKEEQIAELLQKIADARSGGASELETVLREKNVELHEWRQQARSLSAELQEAYKAAGATEAEKERFHADFEKRYAEREQKFQTDWKELVQSRDELQKNLAQRERDLRLLGENMSRLSQQNKELLAALKGYKEQPAPEARAAAAPDPELTERIEELQLALDGRDRMLSDQEKTMDGQRARIEQLSLELKDVQENKRLVQDLTYRLQSLMMEKEKFEQPMKSPAGISAEKDKLAAELAAREKDLEALKKAAAELEAEKRRLEARLAERPPVREGAPPEGTAALEKRIEELKAKNEELETQVRLLVLNTEAIERMEKNLRESFRLMPQIPENLRAAAAARAAAEKPAAGLLARVLDWWRAPLLRISRKKDAPPAGALPAGAERLRRWRKR